MEIRTCPQERSEGMEVEIIGEDLDDYFHEVFLRDDVFAVDDLLEDGGEDGPSIHIEVGPFELG